MENTPMPGEDQGGLDRRTVLRRGAILGGALVWTVPAVQTLAGPAFAAGSSCSPKFKVVDYPGLPDGEIIFTGDADCCDCLKAEYEGAYAFVKAAFTGIPVPNSVLVFLAELLAAIRCTTKSNGRGPCRVVLPA